MLCPKRHSSIGSTDHEPFPAQSPHHARYAERVKEHLCIRQTSQERVRGDRRARYVVPTLCSPPSALCIYRKHVSRYPFV